MPQGQAPATLPANFFSTLPPDTLPANFDFSGKPATQATGTISQSHPEDEGNAAERFLTRLTGLPVKRILDNPNRYMNPLSDEYWNNPDVPQMPTAKEMAEAPIHIPGADTIRDLRAHNYAAAMGDLAPAALTLASMGKASPEAEAVNMPASIPKTAPTEMPASFRALAPNVPALAAPNMPVQIPPAAPAPLPPGAEGLIPKPAPAEPYPEGIQPRPTDRAEILSDKIARERAANDMGMQLYKAKREIGQENAPVPKWQQVAQAKADAIRAKAESDAQQVLADAEREATTAKTLTKTSTKAKTAAAQEPVIRDLNDPDVLMGLLKRSLSDLK